MSSTPHYPTEPTIADVIAELRVMRLEQRAAMAELRLDVTNRFSELKARLETLTDEIADFRAEFNSHYHPPQP